MISWKTKESPERQVTSGRFLIGPTAAMGHRPFQYLGDLS
jgi:hypothetical protein